MQDANKKEKVETFKFLKAEIGETEGKGKKAKETSALDQYEEKLTKRQKID